MTTSWSMDAFIAFLSGLTWTEAIIAFTIENLVIFAMALALGHLLIRRFGDRRVTLPPPPLTRLEVGLTVSTLVLNSAVTVAGWYMWREGYITFRADIGLWALLDVVALFMVMDLAMYVLHRIAHVPWIYPWVHKTHHVFEHPRPLTLFALNPIETLGFGGLWLALITVYDASWLGMSIYLGLNVLFGLVGHIGVEPLPKGWLKWPLLRWLTTSTFHAGHHDDSDHNYGFYTVIWDRLFSSLAANYAHRFTHAGAAKWSEPSQDPLDTEQSR